MSINSFIFHFIYHRVFKIFIFVFKTSIFEWHVFHVYWYFTEYCDRSNWRKTFRWSGIGSKWVEEWKKMFFLLSFDGHSLWSNKCCRWSCKLERSVQIYLVAKERFYKSNYKQLSKAIRHHKNQKGAPRIWAWSNRWVSVLIRDGLRES